MRPNTRPRPSWWSLVGLGFVLSLSGCATSSSANPDADPNAPDADPNAPDADPNAPDADPSAPDARPADANPVDPDANNCVTLPCDLYEQCGCIPPKVCDLDPDTIAEGGTACRDVGTPGTDTSTCSSSIGCAGGYICLGSPGQCRRWCQDDAECPGDGGLCMLGVTYGGEDVPGATTCSKNCDPVSDAPATCPAGYACHVYLYDPPPEGGDDEVSLTDCDLAPTSGGGFGTDCSVNGSSDCAAGYDCVNYSSNTQCMETCQCPSIGNCSGAVCSSGTCYGYSTPAVIGPIPGGIEYGVCIP